MKKLLLILLLLISYIADSAYIDTVQSVQSGAWNVTILNSSLTTTVTSLPSITGTVTANLGTIAGVATESTLSTFSNKFSFTTGRLLVDGSGVTQPVSGPLTDTQLRATPVPVSGTLTVNTGLTDTQLRATPVPVSGTVSTGLTQPLTDTQLRATPVPVSGTVTVNTGLTDTQLRATPVPVSNTSLPLPTGASTETTVSAINSKTPSLGNQSQANSSPVVMSDSLTVTGSAQSVLNTDLLTGTVSGWFDAKSYHSASIQVIGNAGILTGAIIFEQTNDTTNAPNGQPLMVFNASSNALNPLLSATNPTASTNVVYEMPLLARYIRVRISTAFTGGTVQATANFSQMAYMPLRVAIQNGTASNVAVTANGTKTNNSVVPSNTNVGTLPATANEDTPAVTETFQNTLSVDLKGQLRVNNRPFAALGYYSVANSTNTYGGLASGKELFSMRWGDATRLCVIQRVAITVVTSVAATTAAITERQLIVARSWSVSDTGGTAISLAGNNQKLRASFGSSLVTDMRIGSAIAAGTRTLDSLPIASAVAWSPLNHTGVIIGSEGGVASGSANATAGTIKSYDLFDSRTSGHPLVLSQNEGIIVRVGAAEPNGATQQTFVTVEWAEVNKF